MGGRAKELSQGGLHLRGKQGEDRECREGEASGPETHNAIKEGSLGVDSILNQGKKSRVSSEIWRAECTTERGRWERP